MKPETPQQWAISFAKSHAAAVERKLGAELALRIYEASSYLSAEHDFEKHSEREAWVKSSAPYQKLSTAAIRAQVEVQMLLDQMRAAELLAKFEAVK